jgi:hypothetical protein
MKYPPDREEQVELQVPAISISVDCQMDWDRSNGYPSQYTAEPILWSMLGKMQLEEKRLANAIMSFIPLPSFLLKCYLLSLGY